MKLLDYLLILCAIALIVAGYYVSDAGNAELAAVVNFCASMCGVAFGVRLGKRLRKSFEK